jgi:hypothetical protein
MMNLIDEVTNLKETSRPRSVKRTLGSFSVVARYIHGQWKSYPSNWDFGQKITQLNVDLDSARRNTTNI